MHIEAIRERLLERRNELQVRERRIRADFKRESDPLSADFADQAVQRGNDDVLEAIGESVAGELRQIETALQRIDEQRHDVCAECDGPIALERLAIVPYTDRCASCASDADS